MEDKAPAFVFVPLGVTTNRAAKVLEVILFLFELLQSHRQEVQILDLCIHLLVLPHQYHITRGL